MFVCTNVCLNHFHKFSFGRVKRGNITIIKHSRLFLLPLSERLHQQIQSGKKSPAVIPRYLKFYILVSLKHPVHIISEYQALLHFSSLNLVRTDEIDLSMIVMETVRTLLALDRSFLVTRLLLNRNNRTREIVRLFSLVLQIF